MIAALRPSFGAALLGAVRQSAFRIKCLKEFVSRLMVFAMAPAKSARIGQYELSKNTTKENEDSDGVSDLQAFGCPIKVASATALIR